LPSSIQASLGETFLIYGEIKPEVNPQQVADECVENLFSSAQIEPVFLSQSKLFNSLLFEYQGAELNPNHNQSQSFKILVLLRIRSLGFLKNSKAETLN
jgi:hypothetical protein